MSPGQRLRALSNILASPRPAKHLHAQTITTMASENPNNTATPWRAQFLADVEKMDQPTCTFTTLHHTSSSAHPIVPRGRTCIFRGLWANLPPNDKNKAPRNPNLYESDLPVITTDARMAKTPDLFRSPHSSSPDLSHSGGGAPVEVMFWAASAARQWRLRGHAWVLAPGDVGPSSSQGGQAVRSALRARMRPTTTASAGGKDGEWDWEREVVGHFGNLSPAMRGSFKNPPPGTPRATREPGPGEGLGQTVGDELLGDEVARRNFRVVVVVPGEVELVDLGDPADQRRWVYTFVGEGAAGTGGGEVSGEWEKVELWP